MLDCVFMLMRFYLLVETVLFLVTSCPETAPIESDFKELVFLFSSVSWKGLCSVDVFCSLNVG